MLCAFLSINAVLRSMWVKPHAIYVLEYQSTWVSLLSQKNVPVPLTHYVQCSEEIDLMRKRYVSNVNIRVK